MKIMAPLNDVNYLDMFISAGADEFYLGFYDDEWVRRFGKFADINRMSGFSKMANRYSFKQAIELVEKIKNKNKSVFLTLNANVYSAEEIEYICDNYIPDIKRIDVDGVIVSNLEMGKTIVDNEIKAVASTMCAIYNSDIAAIYKQNGIKRMIIPRDVSLEEVENMCKKNSDIEYEVFFMRNGCVFSDCFCLGMHRPECGATCSFLKKVTKMTGSTYIGFKELHDMEVNNYLYYEAFHQEACGMCSLYRFKEVGIGSLKIVGRADQENKIADDISLTRKNIEIMNTCSSEQEFLEKMIFPNNSLGRCKMGLSCYYPEVRFK